MSGLDVSIALVAALVGYWGVAALWPAKKTGSSERPSDAASAAKSERAVPWHMTLEVPSSASVEEIKEAYKRMIAKYHPDKVAQLGPELQRVANEMSMRINSAYQEALKSRGR